MSDTQAKAGRLAGVSEWLAAIHEPHRLAVLVELANGERSLAELAVAIGANPANLSGHLQKRRPAGLAGFAATAPRHVFRLTGATVTPRAVELCHPAGVRVTLDRDALASTMRGTT